MRRASKGTPSSNPAQDRSLCQPRCWQQHHPAGDVAESWPAAPGVIVSGTGLCPPSFGYFGGGAIPWGTPFLGALVVAGWGFAAPEGLRGLGRQQERLQRAGATARVRPKEPQEGKEVKPGKSWGEILQGGSGVRKPRAELSCRGRLCSLCSHGNRSDALQLGCFLSSFLKAAPVYAEERSGAPSRGGAGQCRGHSRDSRPWAGPVI